MRQLDEKEGRGKGSDDRCKVAANKIVVVTSFKQTALTGGKVRCKDVVALGR